MKVLYVINSFETLSPSQTTAELIAATAARSHETYVASISALTMNNDQEVSISARKVDACEPPEMVAALRKAPAVVHDLGGFDVCWIRTNPGRFPIPSLHRHGLALLAHAGVSGACVISDPDSLQAWESKLYLPLIPPQIRPRTIISGDPRQIEAFVEAEGTCVLKGVDGTRGRGVFSVRQGDPNLGVIIETLTERGLIVAQQFVKSELAGDTRILMLEGKVLRIDGQAAAVRRVPTTKDFRSNVHVGARPTAAEYDAELYDALDKHLGPLLRAEGHFLVGADIIGGKAIEVNVFSPGGLGDMNMFANRSFEVPILEALEAKALRHRKGSES